MLVIVSMCVSVCMCVFPNARMTPKICANCNHVVVHMYISEGPLYCWREICFHTSHQMIVFRQIQSSYFLSFLPSPFTFFFF